MVPDEPPRAPGGLRRARETEATCHRFPVVARLRPIPPLPDCRCRLVLGRRSALCLCRVRSPVTSHEAALLGRSSRPPRPPTASAARAGPKQPGSPCWPAGRSSDRSATILVNALTDGSRGPLCSCRGPDGGAHGHAPAHAAILATPP
ncbi:hypothetical protein NDU88_001937 [Pleurodeles waltl]|uniref:Uncharacterized protein n=1 Tax=Pleurodeles waltl TaxID=8319 RepID=A0AAV7NFP5_PLEWA|nr:hypothetical protein NDU88_001937 [Pleurodeles waltl]